MLRDKLKNKVAEILNQMQQKILYKKENNFYKTVKSEASDIYQLQTLIDFYNHCESVVDMLLIERENLITANQSITYNFIKLKREYNKLRREKHKLVCNYNNCEDMLPQNYDFTKLLLYEPNPQNKKQPDYTEKLKNYVKLLISEKRDCTIDELIKL